MWNNIICYGKSMLVGGIGFFKSSIDFLTKIDTRTNIFMVDM